jgi:hypothetical protein
MAWINIKLNNGNKKNKILKEFIFLFIYLTIFVFIKMYNKRFINFKLNIYSLLIIHPKHYNNNNSFAYQYKLDLFIF